MNWIQVLMAVICLLAGLHAFVFREKNARAAVRQAEILTGRRFDERIYKFFFKYGGLAMMVLCLLALLGIIR